MTAPDQVAKDASKALAGEGRPHMNIAINSAGGRAFVGHGRRKAIGRNHATTASGRVLDRMVSDRFREVIKYPARVNVSASKTD
jgi:hypothetical protein